MTPLIVDTLPKFLRRATLVLWLFVLQLILLGANVSATAQEANAEARIAEAELDLSKPMSVHTVAPIINETPRPWIDHTGKRAVVATLVGRSGALIVLDRADGVRINADPQSLSVADRGYALQATESRVIPDAKVLLGKVVAIRDGDTIQLRTIDERTVTVRLDGIDAPEKRQDFGKVASDWLGKIHERNVRIEYKEIDRYQRVLGHIYLGNRWINYELARAGFAWHYVEYNDDPRLAAAHNYAEQNRLGLWAQEEKIAPWDYRNGVRKKTVQPMNVDSIRGTDTVVYVTQSGSHYHTADCRHASKSPIPMPLSRAASAYDRCTVCKPPEHK